MTAVLKIIDHSQSYAGTKNNHYFHETVTFGRATDNDWPLNDINNFISSYHGKIYRENGRYYLVDISTNGTFVNRVSIASNKPYQLDSGDLIKIGEVTLQFYITSTQVTDTKLPEELDHQNITFDSNDSADTENLIHLSHGNPMDDVFSFPQLSQENEVDESKNVKTSVTGIKHTSTQSTKEQTPESSPELESQLYLIDLLAGIGLEPHAIQSLKEAKLWRYVGEVVKTTLIEVNQLASYFERSHHLDSSDFQTSTGLPSAFQARPDINKILLELVGQDKDSEGEEPCQITAVFKKVRNDHDFFKTITLDKISSTFAQLEPYQIESSCKRKWRTTKSHHANCWAIYQQKFQQLCGNQGKKILGDINENIKSNLTQNS